MSDLPAPCTPITSNLDISDGGLLGGVFLSFMFYGANCLQIFIYLVNYPKDDMALKVMVAVTWTFDTVHQILNTVGIWQYLISNYGNYVFLYTTHAPLLLGVVFSVIVSTIAQLFLTHRIWQLSGGIWVFPAFLIPATVSQPVFACIYVIKALSNNTVQELNNINKYATAGNAMAAGTDIMIAIITCTLLVRARAGFNQRTDATLTRLIILSVNSGLWTGIFGLTAAIISAVSTENSLEFAWLQFCMSPLYCNSILGCLNARAFIRDGLNRDGGYDPKFYVHPTSISCENGAKHPIQLNVMVETKQTIDHDYLDDQTLPSSGKQSLREGFIEP